MTAMMSIVKDLISLLLSKKLLFPGYLFCDMNEQFFLINILYGLFLTPMHAGVRRDE